MNWSTVAWVLIILVSVLLGYCIGYWRGHKVASKPAKRKSKHPRQSDDIVRDVYIAIMTENLD